MTSVGCPDDRNRHLHRLTAFRIVTVGVVIIVSFWWFPRTSRQENICEATQISAFFIVLTRTTGVVRLPFIFLEAPQSENARSHHE
jgi:hypothetical protein